MWTALRSGAEQSSPRSSSGRVCALSLVVAAALLLLGFIIGWFTKPTDEVTATSSHEKVKKAFMAEMKAENIKQFL
uniref:Uncharacterized protein n=2 Tax=Chelonoidis abingdonii TaxID=106734 RepID=A0A8C0GGL0_CHEAB